MKTMILLTAALAAVSLNVCAEAPLSVFVSIPPQLEAVRAIGGEGVEAEALLRPGDNPHTFAPSPRQMARLSKADAYVRIGVPFEEALIDKLKERATGLRFIDQRDDVKLRYFEKENTPSHAHEEHAGHNCASEHGGADPHIWLSPKLLKIQARVALDMLIASDPKGEAGYRKKADAYLGRLDALDSEVAELLGPHKGKIVFVYHPAFGYLCDEYEIGQKAVEQAGKDPGPRSLGELAKEAESLGVKTIFYLPQFNSKSARVVADAIGAKLVPLDPMDETPTKSITSIARAFASELSAQTAKGAD